MSLRSEHSFGIGTFLILPVPRAREKEGGRREGRELKRRTVGGWNDAVRRGCEDKGEGEGIVFVDVVGDIEDGEGRVRKEVEGDGTHLGREYARIVADWVGRWERERKGDVGRTS